MLLQRIFPLLEVLSKNYNRPFLSSDIVAGLTVSVVMIPQAIAYAMLAGIPPIYGLSAAFIPAIFYALTGTSAQMSVGPTALISIVIMTGLRELALPFSEDYIPLVLLTGLCIGILKIIMGVLKFGKVIRFLSHPVMYGFISAAAIIIITSQIKEIVGFPEEPGLQYFHEKILFFLKNTHRTHLWSFLSFCLCSVVLFSVKKRFKKFPIALVVSALGGAAVYFFDLDQTINIGIVGVIPEGVPGISTEFLSSTYFSQLPQMIPTILTAAFISTLECATISKSLEMKTKQKTVRPNRELISLGMAKILGSFLQSTVISASFSRSSINHASGAKTSVSILITSTVTLLSLLFLTPIFYYFPKVVLSAIICTSVINLIYASKFKSLWREDKKDFWVMMISFLTTVFLGIQMGILIGCTVSIIFVLYIATKPKFKEVEIDQDTLEFKTPGVLYYGNISMLSEQIQSRVSEPSSVVKKVYIDVSEALHFDTTCSEVLEDLKGTLSQKSIEFHLKKT